MTYSCLIGENDGDTEVACLEVIIRQERVNGEESDECAKMVELRSSASQFRLLNVKTAFAAH